MQQIYALCKTLYADAVLSGIDWTASSAQPFLAALPILMELQPAASRAQWLLLAA